MRLCVIVIVVLLALNCPSGTVGQQGPDGGTTTDGSCSTIDPTLVKSTDASTPVTVYVTNSAPFIVRFIWINWDGVESWSMPLQPGQRTVINSFATNVWIARKDTGNDSKRLKINGTCVFTVQEAPTTVYLTVEGSVNDKWPQHCPPLRGSKLASGKSTTRTTVYVTNEATVNAVLQWVSYDEGTVGWYAVIKPGVTTVVNTFESHVWIATTADGARLPLGGSCSKRVAGSGVQYLSISNTIPTYCPSMNQDVAAKQAILPVKLMVKNEMSSAVKLIWINYSGVIAWFSQIAAGQSTEVTTYTTHPWIAEDAATGERLQINGACYFVTPVSEDDVTLVINKASLPPLCPALDGSLKTGNTGDNSVKINIKNDILADIAFQWLDATGNVSFTQVVRTLDTSYVTSNSGRGNTFIATTLHNNAKVLINNACSYTITADTGEVDVTVTAYDTSVGHCTDANGAVPENTDHERELRITNHATIDVTFTWVGWDGQPGFQWIVHPGKTDTLTSYAGHSWYAQFKFEDNTERANVNGKCVFVVSMDDGPQQVDIIPQGAPAIPATCNPLDGEVYRSIYVDYPIDLYATNLADEPIVLQWLNYTGRPAWQIEIKPGETGYAGTYGSHPWIARTRDGHRRALVNGTCLLTLPNRMHRQTVYLTAPRQERCSPADGSLKSDSSARRVKLRVSNTKDRSIKLFWLNWQGQPTWSTTLCPLCSTELNTFASHTWMARIPDSRQRLLIGNTDIYKVSDFTSVVNVDVTDFYNPYCPMPNGVLKSESSDHYVKLWINNPLKHSVRIWWFDWNGKEVVTEVFAGGEATRFMHAYAAQPLSARHWQTGEQLLINGSCYYNPTTSSSEQWITLTDTSPFRPKTCTPLDGTIRSVVQNGSVTVNVTNHVGVDINFYWLDFGGADAWYRTIPAGQSSLVSSYKGHQFIARSVYSGQRYKIQYNDVTSCSYTPEVPDSGDMVNVSIIPQRDFAVTQQDRRRRRKRSYGIRPFRFNKVGGLV